jgi:hypothetical protein
LFLKSILIFNGKNSLSTVAVILKSTVWFFKSSVRLDSELKIQTNQTKKSNYQVELGGVDEDRQPTSAGMAILWQRKLFGVSGTT